MRAAIPLSAVVLLLLLPGCAGPVTLTLKSYGTQAELATGYGTTTSCGGEPKRDMHVVTLAVQNRQDHALDTQQHAWLFYWPNGAATRPIERTYGIVAPGASMNFSLYACPPFQVGGHATRLALLNTTSPESEVLAQIDLA